MTKNVSPKKLIEVAMPLAAINAASTREKSIRHGHPSTLHLWWARRPLATARAVLFASLVDDPSEHADQFPTAEDQDRERQRLFKLIESLVQWENSNDQTVLAEAKKEIANSVGNKPIEFLDPFAGGGTIPLEAQRLGLVAHARDLNPVAVLINKAMIEIPPKFAGRAPVNPEAKNIVSAWESTSGLAEDVRYYGQWMKARAFERIGHLYPKVQDDHGKERTVIAWLWARTVKCPNPACGCQMPLAATFVLSKKKGHEAYVQPVVKGQKVTFEVLEGKDAPAPPKQSRGANFKCVVCGGLAGPDYIKAEAQAGRMGAQMMAVAAEGDGGRVYLAADKKQVCAADVHKPEHYPTGELANDKRAIWCTLYGLDTFDQLFTNRQLMALTTFSDLVKEAREQVVRDGGDEEYANAVAVYLAFVVDRQANYSSSLNTYADGFVVQTFGRQALPMAWDYSETNVFSNSSGNWSGAIEWVVENFGIMPTGIQGSSTKHAAQTGNGFKDVMVSTDPPYYDNIGYADLSDFFYIWLRNSLRDFYPGLFTTVMTPKADELIASPYRHKNNKEQAKHFFEDGLLKAFQQIYGYVREDIPFTIYYAYKQSESDDSGEASTGWETMLNALISAGFSITGTWPVRSERATGLKAAVNALASSIVLVCRKRPDDALAGTRRDFMDGLADELPIALAEFQKSNLPPVDLAQASIGPGMAVFSKFSKVIEADGQAMTVRTALSLINQTLGELQAAQQEEYDPDTRWALTWFGQHGFEPAEFGEADTLARAKNTSVQALIQAGIVASAKGQARLLKREEMDPKWDPLKDKHCTVWEATQHLSRALNKGGEGGAAALLCKINEKGFGFANAARELAYQLFKICETQGWVDEAKPYNELICIWPVLDTQKEMAAAKAAAEQNMLPLKGDA